MCRILAMPGRDELPLIRFASRPSTNHSVSPDEQELIPTAVGALRAGAPFTFHFSLFTLE